jgi:hypothetical protein
MALAWAAGSFDKPRKHQKRSMYWHPPAARDSGAMDRQCASHKIPLSTVLDFAAHTHLGGRLNFRWFEIYPNV